MKKLRFGEAETYAIVPEAMAEAEEGGLKLKT